MGAEDRVMVRYYITEQDTICKMIVTDNLPERSIPGSVHSIFASPSPNFSKLRLKSKIFFSFNISSMVRMPFSTVPKSEGSSASAKNASSV